MQPVGEQIRNPHGWSYLITFVALSALLMTFAASAAEGEDVRVLFDFEAPSELKAFNCENVALDVVQDANVTSGKNCCRVVGKQGTRWAFFEFRGEAIRNWAGYDYFVMDLKIEREEKIGISFELWDGDSKNYHTRCTQTIKTHPGRNKMAFQINRAKRNGKEGRSWNELEPKDKIRMNGLKKVKIFFTPYKKGGDTVFWIDKLRLMKEEAMGGKLKIKLPPSAKAFDFGHKGVNTPGFTWVGARHAGIKGSATEYQKAWPDILTGDGLVSYKPFTFDCQLPDGEYLVWLSATRLFNDKSKGQQHVLKVGDVALCDEQLTEKDLHGTKGLYRHMRTQYSQRPNALWLDYVEPEAPGVTKTVKVAGGKLTVTSACHKLAGLIVMPAKEKAAFDKLVKEIQDERIKVFYATRYFGKREPPKKEKGDGAYCLWVPQYRKTIRPWTGPDAKERKTKELDFQAAPGQRIVARVCVSPFEDLGQGELTISDLKGPATIPASQIRAWYQNYRLRGTDLIEMALLPWTKIRFEPNLTWAYWLWLHVPPEAKPGAYSGTVTFKPERGGARTLPIKLEVLPIKLEEILPVSYGMYYGAWGFPKSVDRRQRIKEQLQFMREVGFTATGVGAGRVTGASAGKVSIRFDPMLWELAKEVGMGRHPLQESMGTTLGMARTVARRLGLSPAVDRQPGIEFTNKHFKGCYLVMIKKYAAFLKEQGLPVAVEVVDEPREVPNPWNRNLKDTIRYADWIKEAAPELKTFVTPMGDTQSGKDYTPLGDHVDVLSVHATPHSRRMIEKARSLKKTLWFYNTGMDRLSWGFYAWRMNAIGRWEWHWSWGGQPTDGYANDGQWFTPFTGRDGFALRAPPHEYPGGFLFKSAYLNVAQGITDLAYIHSLQKAVATAKGKPEVVKEAQALLDALKKSIPEMPKVKNLASADAGALVGAGIDTPAADLCERWRRKIAALLVKLQK